MNEPLNVVAEFQKPVIKIFEVEYLQRYGPTGRRIMKPSEIWLGFLTAKTTKLLSQILKEIKGNSSPSQHAILTEVAIL